MPSESDGPLPAGRLPCSFHDVAIWIEALHADMVPLVPLLDDADAVRGEGGHETRELRRGLEDRFPKWTKPGSLIASFVGPEGEREALGVVQHKNATVVPARRLRVEAEVGLVKAA